MVARKTSNWTHPDQREDEILLTNLSTLPVVPGLTEPGMRTYNAIKYKSKRRVLRAFDIKGRLLLGMFAVFVSKLEYETWCISQGYV